jgi:hypothetical protein
MGATDICSPRTLRLKTPDEVRKWYGEAVEGDLHERGHSGYTGGWSSTGQVKFDNSTVFEDPNAAYEYVLNLNRHEAVAVWIGKSRLDPEGYWMIAGWAKE